eukprot:gb/GECH01013652.1/.p1 GENE.gb/GECH01013652.1/~~gb/GECH01013652.1/.p1  ORF type:complete len:248 (+),score=60.27 gb/GECH01013652.1/:1-744(+)
MLASQPVSTDQKTCDGSLSSSAHDCDLQLPSTVKDCCYLQNLIHKLEQEFEAADKKCPSKNPYLVKDYVNQERVVDLMRQFPLLESDQTEYSPYTWFCSKDQKPYTRNMVFRNKYFTILVLCWNSQCESRIHAHCGSHCWLRVISGSLTETRYGAEDNPFHVCQNCISKKQERLTASQVATWQEGQITYINDDIGVHKVSNNTEKGAVSLHLYAPPLKNLNAIDSKFGKVLTSGLSNCCEDADDNTA